MSAQRHEARHGQTPSAKTQIESMIALGKTAEQIVAATNRSLDYVNQIIGYHRRTNSDNLPAGDCELHLELVYAAGHGFPFYNTTAAYRVRA